MEVGITDIARGRAWLLVVLFLLTLAVVAPLQTAIELRAGTTKPQYLDILQHLRQAPQEFRDHEGPLWDKLFAANRFLLAKINAYETELEKTSSMEKTLLPPMQEAFTKLVGLGNEQAYLGKGQWLFYRPGVDSVMGPAYLDDRQMLLRSRSGNEWQDPPQPDPVLAIEQFRDQLAERGVMLVVMPVPIKAAILPRGVGRTFMKVVTLRCRIPRSPRFCIVLMSWALLMLIRPICSCSTRTMRF